VILLPDEYSRQNHRQRCCTRISSLPWRCSHHGGKERIREIGNDDADLVRAIQTKSAGNLVRRVAKGVCDLADLLFGVFRIL